MEGLETVGSALLTLGLVAVAVALSLYERLDLERDIGIAVVRSFVQLALPDDEALTLYTDAIFDGLYTYLQRETS